MEVYLSRMSSDDQGTLGSFFCPELGLKFFSMELPWKDNINSISCIPTGKYKCVPRWSKKYKWHYYVTGVDGRSFILIHSGNLAGDRSKGFKTHSHGCILLGVSIGFIKTGDKYQKAVLNSRVAVSRFYRIMNKREFNLNIL